MPPIDKPVPPAPGSGGTSTNWDGRTTETEQWNYCWQVANKYHLSVQTIWGIFKYAQTVSTVSKSNPKGPFGFPSGKWNQVAMAAPFFYSSQAIYDFQSSGQACGYFFQNLLADTNPKSKATIYALNSYANVGTSFFEQTTYVKQVWALGAVGPSAPNPGTSNSGVTPNTAASQFQSPWHVGNVENSHEDIWTGINRNAQAAQWYVFSSGERLYVADGYQLMAQSPAAFIDRWNPRDANSANPKILQCNLTYDNTAFEYVTTHKARSGKIQHKSTLAKVTSPTEITLDWICDIDAIRAGDIVYLRNFGMAEGPWLVGDCTRSIFNIYSSLQLVSAMMPIDANTTKEVGSGGAGGTATGGTVDPTNLTVKGAKMTQDQANLAGQLISIGNGLKATTLGLQAVIYAAIVESGISTSAENPNYWGILSGSRTNFPNQKDVTGMGTCFFKGGRGFTSCLTLETNHPTAALIDLVTAVEGAYVWGGPTSWGSPSQYSGQTGISLVPAEAVAIVAAYQAPVTGSGGLFTLAPGIAPSAVATSTGGAYGASRGYGGHAGVDISMPENTRLTACCSGTIDTATHSWYASSNGKGQGMISIKSDEAVFDNKAGTYFIYGHPDIIYKQANERVKPGDLLALSGAPGGGAHLHFAINGTSGSGNGDRDPTVTAQKLLALGK